MFDCSKKFRILSTILLAWEAGIKQEKEADDEDENDTRE